MLDQLYHDQLGLGSSWNFQQAPQDRENRIEHQQLFEITHIAVFKESYSRNQTPSQRRKELLAPHHPSLSARE